MNTQRIAIIIFSSFVAVSVLYWAKLDDRPQPVIDEYVEKTLNLSYALKEKSFREYPRALYWASIGPRFPLYQALSAPFVLFVNRSADSILIVNAIFLVVMGIASYEAGKLVNGPLAGALSAVFVLTYPIVLNLARLARPHAILSAACAIFFWAALSFLKKETLLKSWFLIASVFLVFLTHASGLYIVIVPFFLLMIKFLLGDINILKTHTMLANLKRNVSNRIVLFGLIPAGSLLIGFIMAWMILKWDQYLGMQKVIKEIFAPQRGMWYMEYTFPDVVSPFFSGLFVIGLIVSLVSLIGSRKQQQTLKFVVFSLIVTAILIHVFFRGAFAWHNLVAIIPLVAVISASGLVKTREFVISTSKSILVARIISFVAILTCFVMAFINYHIVMWSKPEVGGLVRMLGVKSDCTRTDFFCPNSPLSGEWYLKDIVGEIIKYNQCKRTPCIVVLVSQRPEYFHHEALNYTMVQYYNRETISPLSQFYPIRTISIQRTGDSGRKFNWLFADFVIFLTDASGFPIQQITPGFGAGGYVEYGIVKYILKHLNDGIFEKRIERRLPNGLRAVLISMQPVPLINMDKIIDEMDIPDDAKRYFSITN
jgi:hypothetical protein